MDEPMNQSGSRGNTPLGRHKVDKKRVLLRIDPSLHDDLRVWAEDDFRSINAQIEFLLKQAVAKRKGPKADR